MLFRSGRFGFSALTIDSLGNSYVAALSWGSGPIVGYATIKYNASGVQQWVQTYYGPGDTAMVFSIAVDGSANVYVTGSSDGIGTGYDYATIKYSQSIGIQNISSEIPSTYSLSQNYPNPFNPVTKIKFSLPNPSEGGAQDVRLIVYDILGREITSLIPPLRGGQEGLSPGTYEVDWNGSSYASGVYFYRLIVRQAGSSTGDYNETRKMVLVK